MKLPVGYGGVSKIGGTKKRRNPWRARVTDRWEFDEAKGRAVQKFRVIGYFPTKKDALQALADFHKMPIAAGTADVTFSDVWELWRDRNEPKLERRVFTGYRSAFKHSAAVHSMRMHDIRTEHLQAVMDRFENGIGAQKRLRGFWRQLFRLAIERDIVNKNYADFVVLKGDESEATSRRPFTKDELALLWANVGKAPGVDAALIMIYTGVRPSELLSIDTAHVHLEDRWIELHGTKTKAAHRAVPIHKAILPLIEARMGGAHLMAMEDDGRRMQYTFFLRRLWNAALLDTLKLEHITPHCARHTFVSLMVEAGADDRLLKKIVGHSVDSVTDRYTHAYLSTLVREVDKIEV